MAQRVNRDGILRLTLLDGQARAFLMDGTALCEEARRVHNLSRVASAALGRLLIGASMMGGMLKEEKGSVTVTIDGDGPIGRLIAVAKSDASVKGYAEHPQVDLPRTPRGKLDVGGAVGHTGRLAVAKDLGLREPYIGMTKLVSGEIAEDLAMYFTASEQVPSLVSLGVLVGERVEAAGGLILQAMPGIGEADLRSLEASAPLFMDISSTIREYGVEGAVPQLLAHLAPAIVGTLTPQYLCDCSRDRFSRGLIALDPQALREMIDEDRGAQIDCRFCNRRYRFDEQALRALLDASQDNAADAQGGFHG